MAKGRMRKVIEVDFDTNDETLLAGHTLTAGAMIGTKFTVGITNDPQSMALAPGQGIYGAAVCTDLRQSEWETVSFVE